MDTKKEKKLLHRAWIVVALLLVIMAGAILEEISAVTGQNPSTLRVRLHRGRKKLKQFLLERGVCGD